MTKNALVLVAAIGLAGSFAKADDKAAPPRDAGSASNVGEALPAFEATDDQGGKWISKEHTGKNVLVIYFYPGDFTEGCIKQAAAFREGLARLEELGVGLVGVSGDEVATHQLFKQSHGLKHTLLADPEGALAQRMGIPVQRSAKPVKVRTRDLEGKPLMDGHGKSVFVERKVTLPRWTLIIGRDGTLVSKRTNVDPAKDADEVIKIVEVLAR